MTDPEKKNDDLIYVLALSKIPGIGAKLGKQLIAYCGNPEAVFFERRQSLLKIPGIGPSHIELLKDCDPLSYVAQDIEYHERQGHRITHYLDDDYPNRLKHFDDAPILLYSKGDFNPQQKRTVAIVGTRQPSKYGQTLCKELITGLQRYDVQIISGLAYGIDSIAHKESNRLRLQNLAIMGTGMDVIYPAAHRKLANEIVQNGAIISEYPIQMRADKENFPRRNRVIAQLADVIVVVESARKGGSLITAEFGNQYFKDVFAFPGRIGDEKSEGCNALIKQARAHLLQSAEDIAYIMRWEDPQMENNQVDHQMALFQELNPMEQQIIALFQEEDEVSIDWIHHNTQIPLSELATHLLQLEMQGLISALPGKMYQCSAKYINS